ncbi:unnamed protein product [Adineta ricciae]|uniref:Uncharacterized protein n=1 Tax=Adineta ricciae TaxID=249248 RepID=A0A814Q192_ADIRI|nr:unnamed protein product [Adineta ricciae]
MYVLIINLLLFTSSFHFIENEFEMIDEILLTTVTYSQRKINIYTSVKNSIREPKTWKFWYDPLILLNSTKDIYHSNQQIFLRFLSTSSQFDQFVRQSIVIQMHPDVERFVLFWSIQPLPIQTLIVYIIHQKTFLPISSVYPCIQSNISNTSPLECQFHCSSTQLAYSISQQILCGKIKLQFQYYIHKSSHLIITHSNLNSLRTNLGYGKYLHQRQRNEFIEKYFQRLQLIDKTINKTHLITLFHSIFNQTKHFHLKYPFKSQHFEFILNHQLFYTTFINTTYVLFHLKTTTTSPWALTSNTKQTFNIDEIQQMLFNQLQIKAQWSNKEKQWKIYSLLVYSLSDILDQLQWILVTKQFQIDQINAQIRQTIDCNHWSTICTCQSTISALVFTSNYQFVRIQNINTDFSTSGFTFELWIKSATNVDIIRKSTEIVNFRKEFLLIIDKTGQIRISFRNQIQQLSKTKTSMILPLHQWIFVSCVYSPNEKQLQLYLNGQWMLNERFTVQSHPSSDEIIIGRGFLGAVRDVRLWMCPNLPTNILHFMQMTNLTGNERCLIDLWPMTEGDGQHISDLIINKTRHPGTLGIDDQPDLFTDPIWTYLISSPPSRMLSYQIYRQNLIQPIILQWGSIFDIPVPADYDGDGFADFAVYRQTSMTWIISSSNDPNVLISKRWGFSGDIPVQCDFDGDHLFDYTLFRPSTTQWISHLSSNPSFHFVHQWGHPGDLPCAGDYNGDGKTDFCVYRKGAFYINPSNDPTVQWTKQWGQPGDIPLSNCDFDADGKTDFTVWTSSNTIWSWIPSNNSHLIYQYQWGFPYETPFCADFDGDHRTDFGIYRRDTGEWFIMPYNISSFLITFQWGHPTDIPVAGDYDGDGKGDFALWRPRVNRTYVWEIIPSRMPNVIIRKAWGVEGDDAADGDFDGDKRSDLAVFRRSTGFWYTLMLGGSGIQQIKHWGFTKNDTSSAADWNGDLINDFTIYEPSSGVWYIMLSRNPVLQITMQWGVPQFHDLAVPGDFDGDGKFDFTVWRPATGMWFILPSQNPAHIIIYQWGLPDDIPVPGSDFDGDGKTDIAVWRPSTGSWFVVPSSNPTFPYHSGANIRQPLRQLPSNLSNSNSRGT